MYFRNEYPGEDQKKRTDKKEKKLFKALVRKREIVKNLLIKIKTYSSERRRDR